jgi:hypothetical protein
MRFDADFPAQVQSVAVGMHLSKYYRRRAKWMTRLSPYLLNTWRLFGSQMAGKRPYVTCDMDVALTGWREWTQPRYRGKYPASSSRLILMRPIALFDRQWERPADCWKSPNLAPFCSPDET